VNANGLVRFADPLAGFAGLEALARRSTWDDSEIELSARGSEIDLVAWHGLHGHLDWLWGSADFSVDLTGSPGAPDGTLSLVSSRFALGTEELGPVDARGHLEGGWLRIDEGRLTFDEQPLTARGLTPIRLELLGVPALDREAPIALSFDLSGASLALARRVTGRVADAEGALEGMITISGSLMRPLLDGAVRVNGGRVVVTGREETFTRLTGEVTMDGETVRFSGVTATDGEKGRLRASGVLEVRGGKLTGYDATIELERYEVRSSGEYQGTVDATFTFRRGGPAGVGGLPDYSGSVVVHRLDYLREVVGRGGESEPGPSSWVGRFDIELPRNVWIRNTDLQVELKGELTYERDVSGRILLGQLETVRGRYDLFGHTFRITQGEILFTDPVELDPEINVTAETRIPEARIFATITGRASDRQVLLTSDPDYDPATIWRLLVPSDPGEVTNLVALTPLVQEIERALSQEIPGLSLRVEQRIQEGGADPTLGARVGTYVSPDVFVSAYQGFSSGSEQDVSVEYELSDLFFLKGSVVRTGVVEGQGGEDVQEEYNIDLNMRWEF
jgi:translocation and assembly module TamB